jgi:hypothetical protein
MYRGYAVRYRARTCAQLRPLVKELQHLRLSARSPEYFFQSGFWLNELCRQFHALFGIPVAWRQFKNPLLGLPADSWWRSKVLRDYEPKEANDSEIISDREVWPAIRYLDPESDHTDCNIAATIAVLSIVCIVGVVIALLHLRGL